MKNLLSLLFLASLVSQSLQAQDAPVDWQTLASEFAQDAAAAEAKYQGKMITVAGPVSSIAQGDMTTDEVSLAVVLSAANGPGPDVKCLFQSADLPVNTEFNLPDDGSEVLLLKRDPAGNVISSQPFVQTGQQVTVSGSFLSYDAGDIVIQHCRMTGPASE
jgi:hypothetical protein